MITFCVLSAELVSAWSAPTATAPGGNAATLINTGSAPQYKAGVFGIDGNLAVYGQAIFFNKVRIQNSTQGAGKYLTSDGNGGATWQNLP